MGLTVYIFRYHLASWGLVAEKKEFGGLGIPIAEMNMCLLASWVKKYCRRIGILDRRRGPASRG